MADLLRFGLPGAALVSKRPRRTDDPSEYLVLTPEGQALWTDDPEAATPFASMREAMRMAVRLPAAVRAFGLPREVECGALRTAS
ncbi:MAG: hypothetical protein ACHP7N_10150 [Caulobacterales bacterium]